MYRGGWRWCYEPSHLERVPRIGKRNLLRQAVVGAVELPPPTLYAPSLSHTSEFVKQNRMKTFLMRGDSIGDRREVGVVPSVPTLVPSLVPTLTLFESWLFPVFPLF